MKANNRFSIAFIVSLCKKDKTKGLLYARVAVNGEFTKVSLKEQIDPESWDPAREEVKNKTAQAKALNKHIEDVRFRIKEKYLLLTDKESIISTDAVKVAYLGNHAVYFY
jgi:hypothetical protein